MKKERSTNRRPISAENPAFMLMVYEQIDYTIDNVWNGVPDDLKPYVILHLNGIQRPELVGIYETMLQHCDERGIPAMTQIDHAWHDERYFDEAWVERMFKEHPSFLGPIYCELMGRKYETVWPMLPIAAKYGGYVLNNDYLNNESTILRSHAKPDMMAAMRAYPENYVFVTKQTTQSQYIETEAFAFGLWTSGLCNNWGAGYDSWAWWETGRAEPFQTEPGCRGGDPFKCIITYPESQFSMMMYQSALAGATIFANFEHSTYAHGYKGKETPCFLKEIIPTMRKIIEKKLIPPRGEAMTRIRVALLDDEDKSVKRLSDGYYCQLNADDSHVGWLHTTGRYFVVPLLLRTASTEEKSRFPEVIPFSQMQSMTVNEQRSHFNNLYPEFAQGDACIHHTKNIWYLHNSYENRNQTQHGLLNLKAGWCKSADIHLPPNTYALIEEQQEFLQINLGNYRVKKDSIWKQGEWNVDRFFEWITTVYQTNPDESDIRTTQLILECPQTTFVPHVTIEGCNDCVGLSKIIAWDEKTKALSLRISHNGSVMITITKCDLISAGKLKSAQTTPTANRRVGR